MAGQALLDNIWMRRGISLLWDAESLTKVCKPQEVISLRSFLHLGKLGWPEEQIPFVNDNALIVAGLESAIDALPPEEAANWLEQLVYKTVVSFQQEVAGGGSEAALIFWLTEHRRIAYQTNDDSYSWHCGTEYKGQQIPLSRCLFNGAQRDLRRIHVQDAARRNENWIGLFHPRIS